MPFAWPLERGEIAFICSGPAFAFLVSSVAAMAFGFRGDSRRSSYWLGFAVGAFVPLALAFVFYGLGEWLELHLEWLMPYIATVVAVLLIGWLVRRRGAPRWLSSLHWRNWMVMPENASKGFDTGRSAALIWLGLGVFPVVWYSLIAWLEHAQPAVRDLPLLDAVAVHHQNACHDSDGLRGPAAESVLAHHRARARQHPRRAYRRQLHRCNCTLASTVYRQTTA